MDFSRRLKQLHDEGNLRRIPAETSADILDFSTNDYLGLAERSDLRRHFLEEELSGEARMSSSASRLLAACQADYAALEGILADLYGRDVLLFNSGYHANTGIVSAIADAHTLIVADRLVHASIIDGIVLSKAPFTRFRHNDWEHLERILKSKSDDYEKVLVVVESVYSMDGDMADIDFLASLKERYDNIILYVDEAHAFGAMGRNGLGLANETRRRDDIDIIVGTFGKAAASVGAFAAVSPTIKKYLLNTARSFIFSTALPPINVRWTIAMVRHIMAMDAERDHLRRLALLLKQTVDRYNPSPVSPTHIQPLIVGSPERAVTLSNQLLEKGFKVLPIRYPTVARGTERLRISLSAAMSEADILSLTNALKTLL